MKFYEVNYKGEAACLPVCFLDDKTWRFSQMPGTSVKILSDFIKKSVIFCCNSLIFIFRCPNFTAELPCLTSCTGSPTGPGDSGVRILDLGLGTRWFSQSRWTDPLSPGGQGMLGIKGDGGEVEDLEVSSLIFVMKSTLMLRIMHKTSVVWHWYFFNWFFADVLSLPIHLLSDFSKVSEAVRLSVGPCRTTPPPWCSNFHNYFRFRWCKWKFDIHDCPWNKSKM